MKKLVLHFLDKLGEDTNREGLKGTPERVEKMLPELFNKPEVKITTFSDEGNSNMVSVGNIKFHSFCEHHLLPFFGEVFVAYIPNGKIIGLSKIPRIVEKIAGNFQNQERITEQIAQAMQEALNPMGVAVLVRARHLCMEMRGVKKYGSVTTSTTFKGVMLHNPSAKDEFLKYCIFESI